MEEQNPYYGVEHKALADRLWEAEKELVKLRLELFNLKSGANEVIKATSNAFEPIEVAVEIKGKKTKK